MIDPSSPSPYPSTLATPSMYHVRCFETRFDLEQPGAFGRIYPAPALSSFPSSASASLAGLDNDARALVNAWKLKRRREGLEDAAGPDSGTRTTSSDPCSCAVRVEDTGSVPLSRMVGEKRSNQVIEAEAEERKRAKYYTSDDGYGPRGPNLLLRRGVQVASPLGNHRPAPSTRSHCDIGRAKTCSCRCQPSSKHMPQKEGSGLDLSHLPLKLSDVLQRLTVTNRVQ